MSFSFIGLVAKTNGFKSVGVKEFAKYIQNPKVVLLDVRTPAEYAEGHIPGTDFNIDVLEDDYAEVVTEKIPEDRPVALYCRSGNRSKKAARILAEKGYKVVELSTGFKGWTGAGKKIAKP